jgi:hypothetical protein
MVDLKYPSLMLRAGIGSPRAIRPDSNGQGEEMQLSSVVTAFALGLPVMAMSATLTNSNIDSRTTTNVLSFSDLAFDNLDKERTDLLRFHGSVGDAGKFTIDGPFGPSVAVSVAPGSGMSVSNKAFDSASGSVSYRAAITGKSGLTITQSWNVTKSSSMKTGIASNGLRTLEFIGNNDGFLKAGGLFDYSVTLVGDWSTQGTSTGDSQLLGLNPEFTIAKDFVFDAATDTTTLEVINRNYDLSHPNVGLDFIVYGMPAVGEPLPSALLLAGLGALGWVSRRRRARGVQA